MTSVCMVHCLQFYSLDSGDLGILRMLGLSPGDTLVTVVSKKSCWNVYVDTNRTYENIYFLKAVIFFKLTIRES